MLFSKGGVVQNDYFTRLQCTLQCCVDTITDRWIFPQGLRAFPIAFPTVLLLSYEHQCFHTLLAAFQHFLVLFCLSASRQAKQGQQADKPEARKFKYYYKDLF